MAPNPASASSCGATYAVMNVPHRPWRPRVLPSASTNAKPRCLLGPQPVRARSSALQTLDRARQRQTIRVRQIELIPARNVSADALETQNEAEPQTKPFQPSCGT